MIASRDAVGNRWIISQFDEVLDKVRAGNSLSESLALVDGFEQSMSSSIAVGEETGKLDELLATISETLRSWWSPSSCPSTSPTARSGSRVRRIDFLLFSVRAAFVTGHPAGRLRLPFAGTLRPLPRLNSILLFMCSFWNPKGSRYFR